MSTATEKKSAGAGPLAIALLIAFDALAFVLHGGQLAVGSGGLGRWFVEGGPWMWLISLLFLAQGGVALVLGVLHLHRRLPAVLYLILPALLVAAGILGKVLGVRMGIEAVTFAAPDQQLPMWAASLSIADIPRAYAFLAAGSGGLFALVAVAMAAFVRRTPGAHGTFAGVTAGVAAVATVGFLGAGILLTRGLVGLPWIFLVASGLLLGIAPLALAAPGIQSLADSEDETERAQAFPLALVATLGLLLAGVTMAAALSSIGQSNGLQALASAAPDQRAAMLAASFAQAQGAQWLGLLVALASLLAGGPLLVFALPAISDGLRQHPAQLAAVTLLLGVTGALVVVGEVPGTRHSEELIRSRSLTLPTGLTLPSSTIRRAWDPDQAIRVLRDGTLVEHRPGSQRDPGPKNDRLVRLLEGMKARRGVEPRPPSATLALDRQAPGADLMRLVGDLRAEGVGFLELMVSSGDGGEAGESFSAGLPALLSWSGPAEGLHRLLRQQAQLQRVGLGLADSAGPSGLALMLELEGGRATLSGASGTLETIEATPEGEVDGEALGEQLSRIKEAFPDEDRMAVYLQPATTLQQLVDALDAARETGDAWEAQALFPNATLVASMARPDRVEADLDAPATGGILGALGSPGSPSKLHRPGTGTGRGFADQIVEAPAPAKVEGSLSREAVAKVVQRQRAVFRYCYEKELRSSPDLRGKVTVKFVIEGTGAVSSATVTDSTLGNEDVGNCLTTRIRRWRFPAPAGGGSVTVNYPFVFEPSG